MNQDKLATLMICLGHLIWGSRPLVNSSTNKSPTLSKKFIVRPKTSSVDKEQKSDAELAIHVMINNLRMPQI